MRKYSAKKQKKGSKKFEPFFILKQNWSIIQQLQHLPLLIVDRLKYVHNIRKQ